MKKRNSRIFALPIVILSMFILSACGGGGGSGGSGDAPADPVTTPVKSLDQAAYNPSALAYQYGFGGAIPNIELTNAPADTDYSRWAMLNSGANYHLYFFKQGSNTQIYQFLYNAGTGKYDHNAPGNIKVLNIIGAPAEADPSSIAMLHSGNRYRLYMRGKGSNSMRLYQFVYTGGSSYEYGALGAITPINITNAPANADFSGWGMLYDTSSGTPRYRLYAFDPSTPDQIYQFIYDGTYNHNAAGNIKILPVQNMPADADKSDFAMLYGQGMYRFYYRRR